MRAGDVPLIVSSSTVDTNAHMQTELCIELKRAELHREDEANAIQIL